MKRFRWIFILAFAGLAVFSLGALSTEAYAQEGPGTDSAGVKSNDKEISQRKGIAESLNAPAENADTGDGPTKTEMWIGIASIPVMIIVVKYL